MKIAYIFSMKNGIAPFIYSELVELEKNNIKFRIFPTKFKEGLCMPKKHWDTYRFNPFVTILKQPFIFLNKPLSYIKLFFESLSSNTLIYFLIACDYYSKLKDIDRIHCHFGDAKLFIGYYCKKLTGKKLSVTIHAHELYQKRREMFRKSLNYCDSIITISEYNKRYLVKDYNIDSEKIIVNRLFVDTNKFMKKKKIRILIVAQWHEKKGHKYLFEAIKKLNRDDVQAWVVRERDEGYADAVV